MASPMPVPAPVMIAILSFNRRRYSFNLRWLEVNPDNSHQAT